MMTKAHDRYNRLFRQTHKTFQIHHLALLMLKDYITILLGTLQRIHRQYIRYKSALDDTLIGIEHELWLSDTPYTGTQDSSPISRSS